MTLRGHIKNGQVVLDEPATLVDGTAVEVVIATEPAAGAAGSVWDDLLELAGSAGPGLPADLAENHDHYIHGAPKRKRR